MLLSEVEAYTECQFDGEHLCLQNPFPAEFRILHQVESSYWQFHKFWLARPETVAMGEAEKEGEVLQYSMFSIQFCPFCGQKLL